MSRGKTLNAASDDHSFYDKNISDENGRKDLPKIIASYPGELLKRYQDKRSRERRSGAPSPESIVEKEYYEDSMTTKKE
jgi:hypothetical protein